MRAGRLRCCRAPPPGPRAGAGRCVVRATRVDGDRVLVSAEASPETRPLALPKERSNAIGMRCVELALDEKFGGQ